MQLASKIPDMSVQLWSSALLKGTARTEVDGISFCQYYVTGKTN